MGEAALAGGGPGRGVFSISKRGRSGGIEIFSRTRWTRRGGKRFFFYAIKKVDLNDFKAPKRPTIMLLSLPLHRLPPFAVALRRHLSRREIPRPLLSAFFYCRSVSMDTVCPPSSTLLRVSGKFPFDVDLARSLESKSAVLKLLVDEEHEKIKVSMHSGAESVDNATFVSQLYMDGLSTRRFGRLLLWTPRISSTHDFISQNFDELPSGAVCVADVQFKGRGRAKNVWESPSGCLLFSFTLQMEDGRKLPLLQYVVSLAVAEAVKGLCKEKGLHELDVKIKWPNDLYLNGLKVGGILCTSTYREKKFNVSAGIGLNVDNEKPTTSLNTVLRELNSASLQLRREDVLASFFNKFENLFEVLLNQGFVAMEELYYKTWLHSGQKVVIEEKREDQSIEEIAVIIQGLTSSGYLLATDEDSKSFELHPDGNSFDFFKGLVRRKL